MTRSLHVGSLGDQPPADGFGTCSLHRFTRALRCDLRRDPPEGEGCSRARRRGSNSRTVRGPPRCLWSESLAWGLARRAFSLAGRLERGQPLCQPCGASTIASPSVRVTQPCGFPCGGTPDRPHPSHRRAGLHGPCLTTATRTAVPSGSSRLGLPDTRVTTPGSP